MEEELNDLINASFSIEGRVHSQEVLKQGHIHTTYVVSLGEQRYIIQRINQSIFPDVQILEKNLQYLYDSLPDDRDFVIFPFKSLDGKFHVINDKGVWRIFPFAEGFSSVLVPQDHDLIRSISAGWGRFHQITSSLDAAKLLPAIEDFHNAEVYFSRFEEVISTEPSRVGNCEHLIEDLRSFQFLLNTIDKTGLPNRVIHGDTKPSNVLINTNRTGIRIIDLDTIMPGFLFHDFGDMVRSMVSGAGESEKTSHDFPMLLENFKAISSGYFGVLGSEITSIEKKSLIPGSQLVIFEQAVRFLTDYLLNDAYYHVATPEQNLDRARHHINLLRSMMDNGELLKVILEDAVSSS